MWFYCDFWFWYYGNVGLRELSWEIFPPILCFRKVCGIGFKLKNFWFDSPECCLGLTISSWIVFVTNAISLVLLTFPVSSWVSFGWYVFWRSFGGSAHNSSVCLEGNYPHINTSNSLGTAWRLSPTRSNPYSSDASYLFLLVLLTHWLQIAGSQEPLLGLQMLVASSGCYLYFWWTDWL